MDEPSLILNRNWTAIGTATVRQALVLLVRGSARVIEPETYEVFDLEAWLARSNTRCAELERSRLVKTPHHLVEKPEVVLLCHYGRVPRTEVAFSRRNLYRRDNHRCQYCGRRGKGGELSIDHVKPRSRGGPTSWENCVIACARCNHRKADRTPREAGMPLRRAPARPRWKPTFAVSRDHYREAWEPFLAKGSVRLELK